MRTKSQLSIATLLGLNLNACDVMKPIDVQPAYGVAVPEDWDGDGFDWANGECDDEDAFAYPGAAELDSEVDCMRDWDGDGYGDANPEMSGVTAGSDCDDSDPDVNPGNSNCPQ